MALPLEGRHAVFTGAVLPGADAVRWLGRAAASAITWQPISISGAEPT